MPSHVVGVADNAYCPGNTATPPAAPPVEVYKPAVYPFGGRALPEAAAGRSLSKLRPAGVIVTVFRILGLGWAVWPSRREVPQQN
jgi:ribosomal protein L13E